jgi:hypothetical protein
MGRDGRRIIPFYGHARCLRSRITEKVGHRGLDLRRLLSKHHAAFEKKRPQLVDYCRSTRAQLVSNPMDRQQVQLIVVLIGTKRMFLRSTASAIASDRRGYGRQNFVQRCAEKHHLHRWNRYAGRRTVHGCLVCLSVPALVPICTIWKV